MGQSPDSSSYNELGDGVPFFQGKADFGKVNPKVRVYCSSPTKLAKCFDILMSVRAPVGDVNIADRQCCIGRGLCAIRANRDVNNKFLYYFLITQKEKLNSKSTGSTFKAINKSVLEELEVIAIDLQSQQKIASILDRAQSLIDKRKEQIEACDELVTSLFYEMFGDPVINPKNYDKYTLNDICEVVTGNTPSRKEEENYGDYIEWIKSDNINTSKHYLTKAEEYLSEIGFNKGRSVDSGAILMTCIAGSLSCIGNVALTNRTVAFNQQINGVYAKNNNVSNKFMYMQFLLSKEYVQRASTSGMKGMISKGVLSKLEFIVPPREDQYKFANLFDEINRNKKLLEQSLKELENNFNSLMQRAFKGELF